MAGTSRFLCWHLPHSSVDSSSNTRAHCQSIASLVRVKDMGSNMSHTFRIDLIKEERLKINELKQFYGLSADTEIFRLILNQAHKQVKPPDNTRR